jgi:dipeptidyl-peptidase 4
MILYRTAFCCAALATALATSACVVNQPGASVARPNERTSMKWPELNQDFLAQAAATFNFRLGSPIPLMVTADGMVLFRRTPARSFAADLYMMNSKTGQESLLVSAEQLLAGGAEKLSDAEKARRERTRTATRGVVSISADRDGTKLLVPIGQRVFVVDRSKAGAPSVYELNAGAGFPFDPRMSPDGSKYAFVRDGDMWIASTDPKVAEVPRKITSHPAGIEYGTADFAAQEELNRTRGFWWSPDSKYIVFQRTDATKVDTLYVADSRHPDKEPVPFKYPRAGTNNAVVDLGLITADISAGASRTINTPIWATWSTQEYPYLADVMWSPGTPLVVTLLNREQTKVAMLTIESATGKLTPIQTETDEAWINMRNSDPVWLEDGSGYLWMTEASGEWMIERHAANGKKIATLTAPGLGLRSIAGVDEKRREIYVNASIDPTQSHVYRLSLDALSTPIAMSDVATGGLHAAMYKHGLLVINDAAKAGGNAVTVRSGDGKSMVLASVAERPTLTPTTILAESQSPKTGRKYRTSITRPRSFVAGTKYPVLLKVYAGPGVVTVTDTLDAYLMDQWYADAGFIVVRADGRGTPDRGRDWERAILSDLITVPMDDQIDALQTLGQAHPEMDMSRVGVFGWSFGGYFSTMAALMRPDVFHAAVAGAPVTDWQMYDTAYTERYMKTPAANVDGYARTSALTYAEKLSRPLLIIHGITDDNVHFAHTLALIEKLYVAGKRAEVVTLSATHMVPDPKLNLAREQVQVDFFRQHL